jgi:hypothetical protein
MTGISVSSRAIVSWQGLQVRFPHRRVCAVYDSFGSKGTPARFLMGHVRYRIKWRYLLFICAALLAGPSPGAAQRDTVARFDLQIADGRLTEARKVITVRRGDRVEINWRADRPTVLHLHGYDIEVAAGPDKTQPMAFTAHATGRFPIETHARPGETKSGHHTVLLYLEVHPR